MPSTKRSRHTDRRPAKPAVAKKAKAIKPTPAEPESILGRAMLANVCISMWEGRKHDREVTQKVHDDFHAEADSGRYHKHLFGGRVQALSGIITAAAGLRGTHYNQTLPWSDAGWRLLPTANYMQYAEAMRKAQARFNDAVGEFVAEYPKLVKDAEAKLKGMYRATDYPHPLMVKSKFRVSLDFAPLPAGEDFRLSLPQEELERLAVSVEDRVRRSTMLAMEEAWARLGESISKIRGRLDDGKGLRASMLERTKEMAEILGRLNLTNDPALEVARTRVLNELTSFDVETLKDDDKARAKAAASADSILKSMAGVWAPAPEVK